MDVERRNDTDERYWQTVAAHLVRYGGGFLPLIATRAQGCFVYDRDGRAILDFSSGQMCATLGHNHPAVVEAIKAALAEPLHLYSNMLAPAVIELAEALGAILPPSLQKSMFLSTGGEANEAALRMAKLRSGGFEVIALGSAWHGMTAGAQASTYAGGRKGHGPTLPGAMAIPAPNAYRCPVRHCAGTCDMTCLEVGFEMADNESVDAFAAVLCEPVLSAGGVIVPPDGYLRRLEELCRARGMLLIFDEAQTGLGRVGSMFYFEQAGVVPDILTLSKTLGGGIALSATITSAEIEAEIHDRGFLYYTSHVSDPLPARVALSVLGVLIEEKLCDRARELGAYLMTELKELQARFEVIGDVRGLGLLIGVELVEDRERKTPAPDAARRIVGRCLELGLHAGLTGPVHDSTRGTVWKLAPPLTVTKDEIDQALSIIEDVLRETAA